MCDHNFSHPWVDSALPLAPAMPGKIVWRAEGCPPYPPAIIKQLEEALEKEWARCEIMVQGRAYLVRLRPKPFRQILKADATKTRLVMRDALPPEPSVCEILHRRVANSATWRCVHD